MITREQYEQREIQAQEARERFLGLLASAPTVAAAYEQLQRAERDLTEAQRDMREVGNG